jgi:hypothetical protein
VLFGLVASSRGVLVAAAGDVRIQADGDLANSLPGAFDVVSSMLIAGILVSSLAWLAVQIPAYRQAQASAACCRLAVQPLSLRRRGHRAAFTGRLRKTIDLDTVSGDLAGVVHEAFQPAHVSMWLPRPGPQPVIPALTRTAADQPDT